MAEKSITKTELVASNASATGQSQATVSIVVDARVTTVAEAGAKGGTESHQGWNSVVQLCTPPRT